MALRAALPHLRRARIVGKDVHKPDRPEVPEMEDLFLVNGFAVGIAMVIAFG